MGLLDDAIREHLELKRLRGADPGEVAREQREALDPVPRHGEEQPQDDHSVTDDQLASGDAPEGFGGEDRRDVPPASGFAQAIPAAGDPASSECPDGAQPSRDPDFSNVGQETAELDMRTVLDESPGVSGFHATSDPAETVAGSLGEDSGAKEKHPEEESLEWEVHPSSHEHGSGTANETDGRVPDRGGASGEAEDAAEDVLEETPDFLRDTPEQERLWFEQRPPRDFDFDK